MNPSRGQPAPIIPSSSRRLMRQGGSEQDVRPVSKHSELGVHFFVQDTGLRAGSILASALPRPEGTMIGQARLQGRGLDTSQPWLRNNKRQCEDCLDREQEYNRRYTQAVFLYVEKSYSKYMVCQKGRSDSTDHSPLANSHQPPAIGHRQSLLSRGNMVIWRRAILQHRVPQTPTKV